MEADERYREARRRAGELRAFYTHLLVYVIVNLGLLAIDVAAGDEWWFFWPAASWGIGVLAHGFAVSARRGFLGADWERRKIEEYLDR